ncbi:NmrA-like family protein [Xylariaceae sp. FL0255]|nr:NmrA-like family protein [Xylariaceae sp. FL0255]
MAINRVAIIGANGNLGTELFRSLASAGHFALSVVKRTSSKSATYSNDNVTTVTVDDDLSLESLKKALQGQDAVVVSIPVKDIAQHIRIADAAAAVGVKRLIPADYGSYDSASLRAQQLVPLFKGKTDIREHLQTLSASHPSFSWTSLVGGHFFDWGLKHNFLHFDLKNKTADILDGGCDRSSTSTLSRLGEAVVAVLLQADSSGKGEDRTKNRVLFMQSFCVSQLEILAALEKATPGSKWKANHVDSEMFIKEHKIKADAGDKEAVEDLVFALGAIDGNWTTRDGFAMDLLGLEDEDLDEVVKRVVNEAGA